MKKVKLGNEQFPKTYIEKEFSDNSNSTEIMAGLFSEIIDKLKLGNSKTISDNKIKDLGVMLKGFVKEMNKIEPKFSSELKKARNKLKNKNK